MQRHALASQDWSKVEPLSHDNAYVQFSEGTNLGKARVETAFERAFNLIQDETYATNNVKWIEMSDELAVRFYTFAWSALIHGKEASGGRETSVLKREKGNWQLMIEHLGPKRLIAKRLES